jgi:hypothetical protein
MDKAVNEIEYTVITEGTGTRIVSFVGEYEGKTYFNIRKQYRKKGATEWSFTRDGIAIPLDDRKNLVRLHNSAKAVAKTIFGG